MSAVLPVPTTPDAAASLLARASRALGRRPTHAWWVPGRIEVLGKHTDYCGGSVLTCATDLGLVVVAAARDDGRVTATSDGRRVEVALAADAPEAEGWARYVATAVRRLARDFPGLGVGADLAIAANLPPAAGLSSSSALLIAMATALAALNRLDQRPEWRRDLRTDEDLAHYLACVENGSAFRSLPGDRGVGTTGGSEDHLAILAARAGTLTRWRCAPVARQADVPLADDLAFVVADSGVVAEKTGAARDRYNAVAGRARAALAVWNAASGRADANLGAAFAALGPEPVLAALDGDLRQRTEQCAEETLVLVPAATAALAVGDLAGFTRATARSQALAESHLGNQVAETITLVALARATGAIAASSFGAGFGGAVWALVPATDAHAFARAWSAAYGDAHPARRGAASVHVVRPGPPLHPITLERP